MQKKKMQQPLYSRNHGIFSGVRLGRRAVTAICLMGTMLPFAPPAESAFAAMVQNVPDQAGRQDMEIIPEATPSNATFSDATPSDAVKETPPDGFYTDRRESLYYRKDGETVKSAWIYEDDHWYYAGANGKMTAGWEQIDGVWYFFLPSGKLADGWIYEQDVWYYMTENGMLTGYQELDGNDFYFYEDGRLAVNVKTPDGRLADQDGYLYDPSVVFPSFTYHGDPSGAPGTISGLSIAGKPVEFYMLSIAGETSGGQIIMGDRGRAYGMCQLDYRYDLTDFIRWAYGKHPELWAEFAPFTGYGNGDSALIGNMELAKAFRAAMDRSYEGAVTDQLEFMRERYWDAFSSRLNAAGYDLDNRSIAVSAALFSVNVNCGNQPDLFIRSLSPDMTDAEMICKIYDIRNTALADQMVGRIRKGTTGRYRFSEPEMALDLLYGYMTMDTVRSYGHGVEWHGNIFTGSVLTCGIQGRSTDWQEYLTTHEQDVSDTEIKEETEVEEQNVATPSEAEPEVISADVSEPLESATEMAPEVTENSVEVPNGTAKAVDSPISTPSEAETVTETVTETEGYTKNVPDSPIEMPEQEYGPGMIRETEATDSTFCDL